MSRKNTEAEVVQQPEAAGCPFPESGLDLKRVTNVFCL